MRSFFPGRDEALGGDRLIDLFETLWREGEPSLRDFWDEYGADYSTSLLVLLVKIDLRRRYDRGERPSVAPYLNRFPELVASSGQVVSLVYEEFCLREEKGEQVDSHEFCAAYEPWQDSLLSQLAYHRNLSQAVGRTTPSPRFPSPGDRFDEYTLGPLLGKGGMAHVYLATEDALAERQVAIKISARVGREASILAMLDHRNIVSLLSVTKANVDGLRGICMPYRPGTTLERLIREFGAEGRPKTARGLWNLLGAPPPEATRAAGDPSGWAGFPIEGSFHDAVAWIGLCLANALAHAHDQGILHRDVKPANILMALRGGPQLLDFNLADDPKAPEEAKAAHQGGTLPYMAPEQLRAFLDPSAWDGVDAPADLFSLGLVLRELATGQAPASPKDCPSLPRMIQALIDRHSAPTVPARKLRPDIPPALESILAKCLAFEVGDRYAGARELAEDLRKFLDRRPLRHAPNTSIVERMRNFGWRNRRGLVTASVLALAVPIAIWAYWPFHKTRGFAAAIAALDGGRLEEARIAFDGYYKAHPNSAWSQLYYGLTLRKMNKGAADSSVIFTRVPRCPDAEAALLHRLEAEPGSSFLLTELGQAYIHSAARLVEQGRDAESQACWEKARDVLEQACRARSPVAESFITLVQVEDHLADLATTIEVRASHRARAVELITRAIDMTKEPSKAPSSTQMYWYMYRVRRGIMLARNLGSFPSSPENREKLRKLYDLIEGDLPVIDRPWTREQEFDMEGSREYCLNYLQGLIARGRAKLAREDNDQVDMIHYETIAYDKFQDALKVDPEDQRARKQIEELFGESLPESQQGE